MQDDHFNFEKLLHFPNIKRAAEEHEYQLPIKPNSFISTFAHEKQGYLDRVNKLKGENLSGSGNSNLSKTTRIMSNQLDAVIIRNLTYEAGRGRGKKTILNQISLTVPEASIYGLLGPSGCGKTTMLRCVVGRIRPRAGNVLVFGLQPGDGRGHVPGRHVGYMPQEISIYEDFTIEETLIYFGKINRMHSSDIKRRVEFLLKFLDLPTKKRLVVNLSGGQKRRVSLAAALVHSPPLLILDEPTVGVDPLLRQNIWHHLVTLTRTERISVIITTHYIEEARQANVVGLMRHGKILAENSPDELMRLHGQSNLEDVFLKLCVTDSGLRAASKTSIKTRGETTRKQVGAQQVAISQRPTPVALGTKEPRASVTIHTGTSTIELHGNRKSKSSSKNLDFGHFNEAVENFSSEGEDNNDRADDEDEFDLNAHQQKQIVQFDRRSPVEIHGQHRDLSLDSTNSNLRLDEYLAMQSMKWAARRSSELNLMMNLRHHRSSSRHLHLAGSGSSSSKSTDRITYNGSSGEHSDNNSSSLSQWWKTLMAVTWKNYIRLRRNPPVLVFQFMLPAIQVILFCLCIGGEPFDVPVAIVNEELVPKSSLQFLNGLNRKIIRQIKYDNLTSATEAVRRGEVWGAIHIPDKYSENLQSRLIMGEEVTKDTITNGTIRVYPDLTNLHLALALENTFRETFINFARNSLEEMGYDKSLADLPIQMGKPIYGTTNKNGYLEFMAPGVVISISYVMATGLTALAFILERRDGLLERSLVSGVQTNQILLAHAINQIVVMVIQIFMVLGCTFFIFEIPSRGPFAWVVLLILLQGCTGMGFGLLVSAICKEENTAVMMVVGTFYTNLILAGIIWPIEAMPHWLRPVSYAQPQTLPTDSLRHILSRGWGIGHSDVLLGFGVTIGWLLIFLLAAGCIFKYSS